MRKILVALILTVVGFTVVANGFRYQRGYEDTVTEKEVEDLLVYRIGNMKIQAQFNPFEGTISYFVNDVYIVEGYDYKVDGYVFYTRNGNFYLGKGGNALGDNFYIEPVFDDVNPFEEDVNPFED